MKCAVIMNDITKYVGLDEFKKGGSKNEKQCAL